VTYSELLILEALTATNLTTVRVQKKQMR